jgi:hypothetical protein
MKKKMKKRNLNKKGGKPMVGSKTEQSSLLHNHPGDN